MSRLIFIVFILISQSVFADDGEREILKLNRQLLDQSRHLEQTIGGYIKHNRSYWGSKHNKEEEIKLLFDTHSFIASMNQFNNLIERNNIDYTYYELPHALYRVLEDFIDVDEQIKLLDSQHRTRREFERHFNLNALRRDVEGIQNTLKRLGRIIKRIPASQAALNTLEPAKPKQSVVVDAITLFKKHSHKPKYKITGTIIGQVSSAQIVVQRSFSGSKQYDVVINAQGKFVAYFRNYWNAQGITLEIRFTNGENVIKEIDVN